MKHTALANAELAIMDLLWKKGPLTSKQIRETLYPDALKAQHGTVQKLLKRLEEKKYIQRDRHQTNHSFSALVSHQDYTCSQVESLADKLTKGAITPLITNLIENKKISDKEIHQLRTMLDEYDGEKDE